MLPLARISLDHVPCVVLVDTTIPKARVFWFENYWVDLPGFLECVSSPWTAPILCFGSATSIISKKFKRLMFDLKKWGTNISSIKRVIMNCSKVIVGFDSLEELRPWTRPEFNFRKIVKLYYEELLRL